MSVDTLWGQDVRMPESVPVEVDGLDRCGECGEPRSKRIAVPVSWDVEGARVLGELDVSVIFDEVRSAELEGRLT